VWEFPALACGVVQSDGSVLLEKLQMCDQLVLTNCTTLTEAARVLCPDACPYLEQSVFGSCGAACVAATGCGAYRPEHGLANPKQRLCQECPVLGCIQCNMTHCLECQKGHTLSDDGQTCENWRRRWAFWIFGILGGILAVVLVLMGLACALKNFNPTALQLGWQHRRRCMPHKVESMVAEGPMSGAIYRSDVSLYPLTSNVHRRNILGVGFALYYNHLLFVACFAALAWLLLMLADSLPQDQIQTFTATCGYGGEDLLAASQASYAWARCVLSLTLWVLLLASSLAFASIQASSARAFAAANKHMRDYALLAKGFPPEATDPNEIQQWFEQQLGRAIVGVSIAYDIRGFDKEVRRLLDEHLTRRDLARAGAIGIPGAAAALARDPSSPKAQRRSPQAQTPKPAAAVPQAPEAPPQVDVSTANDGVESFEHFCKQWISDLAASEPLDFESSKPQEAPGPARRVNLEPSRENTRENAQDGHSPGSPARSAAEPLMQQDQDGGSDVPDAEQPADAAGQSEASTQERSPADFLRQLSNTGEAFVVCHLAQDTQDIFAMWGQQERVHRFTSLVSEAGRRSRTMPSPLEGIPSMSTSTSPARTFRGHSISLSEISSEPTSVVWHHFGTSRMVVARRAAVTVALFLLVLVIFNLLLYFPVTQFVLRFAQHAGEGATFWQTAVLGVVVGAESTIIQAAILVGVPRLGFKRKEQSDSVTFALGTLLVLSNTLAVVLYTAQRIASSSRPEAGILSGAGRVLELSEKIGEEMEITQAVSRLFITGTFIVPTLGYFLSYPVLLGMAVFVIRLGIRGPWIAGSGAGFSIAAELTARQAEHLLSPMEVWLPWDYGNHIQLPSCALAMLFLPEANGSSSCRMLLLLVIAWSAVMYCAQHIIHLRASKETFFTTPRLDTAVLFAWGPLPLGLLPVLSVYWLSRAVDALAWLQWLLLPLAFAAGCAIYWLLLLRVLAARQAPQITHADAEALSKDLYESTASELRYSYFNTNPIYVLASEHLPEWRLPRMTWYEAGKAYLQTQDPRGEARLEAARTAAEILPDPGERQQGYLQHLMHRAKVWVLGAPPQAYETLDQVE